MAKKPATKKTLGKKCAKKCVKKCDAKENLGIVISLCIIYGLWKGVTKND